MHVLTACALVPCVPISLMAYGREWTGRIEYKGGEKRMAWSYQGTPAAAKQHVLQTLAPRAQLILSVDPSAIREDVIAAATSVAEEVRLSVHLACQPAFVSTCLRVYVLPFSALNLDCRATVDAGLPVGDISACTVCRH
eukprot:COSAG02_NODE_1384_length_12956_cov_126.308446_4_plen_139_part_00